MVTKYGTRYALRHLNSRPEPGTFVDVGRETMVVLHPSAYGTLLAEMGLDPEMHVVVTRVSSGKSQMMPVHWHVCQRVGE